MHDRYIKGTQKGAVVQNVQAFLCYLTGAVYKGASMKAMRVYINTRVLKHVYDKRPAQEYDLLITHLHKLVRFPKHVYQNQSSKRGDYLFVRNLRGGKEKYLCSLQYVEDEEKSRFEVTTFFWLAKENYLNNYKLLWSWEDDSTLHRNAFDSSVSRPNSTPQ